MAPQKSLSGNRQSSNTLGGGGVPLNITFPEPSRRLGRALIHRQRTNWSLSTIRQPLTSPRRPNAPLVSSCFSLHVFQNITGALYCPAWTYPRACSKNRLDCFVKTTLRYSIDQSPCLLIVLMGNRCVWVTHWKYCFASPLTMTVTSKSSVGNPCTSSVPMSSRATSPSIFSLTSSKCSGAICASRNMRRFDRMSQTTCLSMRTMAAIAPDCGSAYSSRQRSSLALTWALTTFPWYLAIRSAENSKAQTGVSNVPSRTNPIARPITFFRVLFIRRLDTLDRLGRGPIGRYYRRRLAVVQEKERGPGGQAT